MLSVCHPPTYLPERRYIYEVLLRDFLGLEYRAEAETRGDIRITFPGHRSDKELILADVLFQTSEDEWLTPASLPRGPLEVWKVPKDHIDAKLGSQRVPVIYGNRLPDGSFCKVSGAGATLGLDIFGSAFFMLARYEEVAKPDRDARDRFPAGASLAYQEGFLDRPIVNEYLEVLWWALKRLEPRLARKRRAFRVLLSHDVDRPFCTASLPRTLKGVYDDVVSRRAPALAKRRAQSFMRVRREGLDADLCNTFDFIMELSEKHALRSSFYFLAGRSAGALDGNYSMNDPWIKNLLRRIHERGHEIGLHGSYNTFRDPPRIRRELALLLRAAETEGISQREYGGRQHYLRWEAPVTWQAWEDAGLDYDATLSFADRPGFRCGTCYEHQVFNLRTRRALRLRERPLVVMEGSLLSRHYMDLTFEQARTEITKLKERCRLFGGDFTLLWHNNMLVYKPQQRLYGDILE
jgi:peptidoglycan/xylan/chitin deacetylase (PgdA/CDA1 family)